MHDACNQVVSTQYRGSMQASYNQVVASTNIPTTHPRATQPGQASGDSRAPGPKRYFPAAQCLGIYPCGPCVSVCPLSSQSHTVCARGLATSTVCPSGPLGIRQETIRPTASPKPTLTLPLSRPFHHLWPPSTTPSHRVST